MLRGQRLGWNASDPVGDEPAVADPVDRDGGGNDVSERIEGEGPQDPAPDPGRTDLAHDRRATPVRPRDGVEQHLGGLCSLRGPRLTRLGGGQTEGPEEPTARGRKPVWGGSRLGGVEPLTGRPELTSDVFRRERVGRDEDRVGPDGGAEVLDEPLRVQLRQPGQVDGIRPRRGDLARQSLVRVVPPPDETTDGDPEIRSRLQERDGQAEDVVVCEVLTDDDRAPCAERRGEPCRCDPLCDVVRDDACVAADAVRVEPTRRTRVRQSV